jgi:hypothetical protein
MTIWEKVFLSVFKAFFYGFAGWMTFKAYDDPTALTFTIAALWIGLAISVATYDWNKR